MLLSVCARSRVEKSEMMLQNDGPADNKCTCFLYLRPTDTVKELLVLWEQSIIRDNASEDQARAGISVNCCFFFLV